MKLSIFIAALGMLLGTANLYAETEAQIESSEDEAHKHHGDRSHHRGHPGARHHRQRMKHMMNKVDLNEDGQVDLNEFLSSAEQRFTAMDANSDGYVTRDEMREAGKAMRKEHRKAMKEARKAYKESRSDDS